MQRKEGLYSHYVQPKCRTRGMVDFVVVGRKDQFAGWAWKRD